MKISLCMIVKDEEAVLARCLESVKGIADEIVIADTGSTDRTVELARRYGCRVLFFAWKDDFAAARNFVFSAATGDYLLWLDADDVVKNADLPRLFDLLEREKPDMLICPYETGGLRFYRERFLRREAGFVWQGRVHECIPPRGKRLMSDFTVLHLAGEKDRGARNLNIYRKWASEEKLVGRDLFYYGRELFYNKLYTEAAAVLSEMLRGEGWYVNQIEACRVLAECLRAQGKRREALSALLESFRFGEPRAAVLCDIGKHFTEERKWREAAYWYERAAECPDHAAEGDFEIEGCRDLIPLLQLVVCYWNLGERKKALLCHQRTMTLAPTHPSVLHNRRFFASLPPV